VNLEEKLAIIKKLLIETSKEFGISIEKIILLGQELGVITLRIPTGIFS